MSPASILKLISSCNMHSGGAAISPAVLNRVARVRDRCFRAKILLVNLHEAPLNAHMEQAFARAVAAAGKNLVMDVLHSFSCNYDFLSSMGQAGLRLNYSGMTNLRTFMENLVYDAVVFIDLPYKDEDVVPYSWLAMRSNALSRYFIANDILLPRGSIFGMDLAENLGLFGDFSAAYPLNQHSREAWGRFGFPPDRIFERDLAVDCRYYDGSRGNNEEEYFCACGQAARHYPALIEAARELPARFRFKLYAGKPPRIPTLLQKRIEIVPVTQDSRHMRRIIAGARGVVLPIGPDEGNPGAGLTVSLIAMAMRKIVLTRGNPCIHRYLKNGVNAFTYPQLSGAGLLRGIRRILSLRRCEADLMVKNARKTVLRMNNLDSFAKMFLKRHILSTVKP